MKNVKHAFDYNVRAVPISKILGTRKVSKDVRGSVKYKSVLASIKEIGIVEPIAIYPSGDGRGEDVTYILLDGHLRLEALRELGAVDALCLVATEDEGFTYNRQINRLTAIQEHKMVLEAIGKGVTADRIAKSLNMNIVRVRESQNLLNGITPEVISLLKTQVVSRAVFAVLKKMKPMRQIETAEMMMAASCFTVRYAKMMFSMTPPDQVNEARKIKRTSPEFATQDVARMEREMEKLYQSYHSIEDSLGETMLVLVVAKGYVSRLLSNDAVIAYIKRFQPEIGEELAGVIDAVTADARVQLRE